MAGDKNKSSKPTSDSQPAQSWRRSREDREILGVCGALASHLEMPSWLVRLAFILLMPVFGLPLIAYVVLTFVIPAAKKPNANKKPAALYHRTDWMSAGITFLIMMIGYCFSLAPDLTLEDSGELAVGSMYAGVPHPPGYPVWTLYTWLFTKIIPFSNMAFRVALSSAFAGAVACGLIALMVSRGSAHLFKSIGMFDTLEAKIKSMLGGTAGFVAGALMGFNGFMWSQAVIVEVYTPSVLSLVGVLLFLQMWIYQQDRKSHLYWAMFLFGICFTNHQTLIVAAVGIEVLILLRNEKLGRDLFFFNSVIFLLGLLMKPKTLDNPILFKLYLAIGILSIGICAYYTLKTESLLKEHWCTSTLMGFSYFAGVSFYLYMPLASLTNPPMNWGYPRTLEGFKHALTRGQYESANPTSDPVRFLQQIFEYFASASEEFSAIYLLIAVVPFLFFLRIKKQERSWIGGLTAVYFCLAFFLLILLNPAPDRQAATLNRVFFTASHVMIAMFIGYAVALIGAISVHHFRRYRMWLILGALFAVLWSTFKLFDLESQLPIFRMAALFALALSLAFFCCFAGFRNGPPIKALIVIMALMPIHSALQHWWDNEERGHLFGFWFGHDMFTPPFEDDKGEPIYPEMDEHAILFGGTDPGRFNPTYMIFCESFIDPDDRRDPDFDRRDVYIITQNALADGTYLQYIRAHYNRSAQIDPPFLQDALTKEEEKIQGLTNGFAKLFRPLDNVLTSIGNTIEKERRVGESFFEENHFLDAAAIASKLKTQTTPLTKFLYDKLSESSQMEVQNNTDPDDLAEILTEEWNQLIDGPHFHTNERFEGIPLSPHVQAFVAENPQLHSKVRLNRLLLEEAFPGVVSESKGGLYPDREIKTPSHIDSGIAFKTYTDDAQERLNKGQLRPGENIKQVGDRVSVSGQAAVMAINAILTKMIFDANPNHEFYLEESFPLDWMFPHLSPYGIILKINREPLAVLDEETLSKDHEFWRKYSQRLIGDWITYDTSVEEIVHFARLAYIKGIFDGYDVDPKFVRDDNAKKAFSKLRSAIAGLYTWRINNSRTVPEQQRIIKEAEFALKQAYAFCPYSPEALVKYASFLASFGRTKEAFLIAELSLEMDPENELMKSLYNQFKPYKDQPITPQTKAKPAASIPDQIKAAASNQAQAAATSVPSKQTNKPAPKTPEQKAADETRRAQIQQMIERMADEYRKTPTNLNLGFQLASYYIQLRKNAEATAILDGLLQSPKIQAGQVAQIAQIYGQLGYGAKMETSLRRLTEVAKGVPEPWYDLAATQAAIGNALATSGNTVEATAKNNQAVQSLTKALQLHAAAAKEGKANTDLKNVAQRDPRFTHLRENPEFKELFK